MAMTEYTGETEIITNIGTTPDERGLTTEQFKAKFDEGLKAFVTWFNDTHKTEFDAHLTEITTHTHKITNITDLEDTLDGKANKAQEAWTTQTLLNGWKQAYQIGYFKDEFGFVHLRGEIYNGTKTVGTTLFTLSDGYRPGSFKVFATSTTGSDGTTVQIQSLTIDTSGNVKIAVKSALTYIVLENISFKV